nr:hypothetical protein [Candidatus Sigynarchaeota archaeon]
MVKASSIKSEFLIELREGGFMKEMNKYYIMVLCIVALSFMIVVFSFKYLIDARLFTQGLQELPFIFLVIFLPLFFVGILLSWIRIEKTATMTRSEIRRHKIGPIRIELRATVTALMLASMVTVFGSVFLGGLNTGFTKIYFLQANREYEDYNRDAPVLEATEKFNLSAVVPEIPAGMEIFPPCSYQNETGLRYIPRIYNLTYFANISLQNSTLNVSDTLHGIEHHASYVYGTNYAYFAGYETISYDVDDFKDSRIFTFKNNTWNQESNVENFTAGVAWIVSVHYQYFSIWSEIDTTPVELFILDVIIGTNSSKAPTIVAYLPPLSF